MRIDFLMFFLALVSFHQYSIAVPAQVMIIRHGEKPPKGIELNTRGKIRAEALVPYFVTTPELLTYGLPAALYAQKQVKSTNSIRPIETIRPLSEYLNIPINTTFERDNYQGMINEILNNPAYEGKSIVISWGHAAIGEMAHAFGAKTAPEEWPSVYDRVWLIKFNKNKSVSSFSDLPQRLLYDDSKN